MKNSSQGRRGSIGVLSSGRVRASTGGKKPQTRSWPLELPGVWEVAAAWLHERGCHARDPPAASAAGAEPLLREPDTELVQSLGAPLSPAAGSAVEAAILSRADSIERLGCYWGFFDWLSWGWARKVRVTVLVG